jgi:long-subunit acyl-CoA synthetase (AMP-forming)
MNDVFYVFEGKETTYAAFSRQVARRAHALPECRGEVVALLAAHGPDLVVNLFALWQAGAVPFLVSTRVPSHTIADLMDAIQARILITDQLQSIPSDQRRPVRMISAACEREDGAEQYDATAVEPPDMGAVILHTSGTTSSPKLVRFSRTSLLTSLSFEETAWNGRWTRRDASLGWLPLYHAFGLVSELLYAYRVKSRYYFSEASPRALLAHLEQEPITLFSSVPWMLEKIMGLPGGLAALARLRWIVAGGAAPSPGLGSQLVAAGVRFIQQYGMTELGAALRSSPDGDWRDLWPVIPAQYWSREPGTGQLVMHANCPISGELATRDTFDRAPSGALRYRNRIDDVLVHVNGEKSNAPAIEQMVLARASSAIDEIVVCGSGRRRPACLVVWKRHSPAADDCAVLGRAIDETNKELPRHSQLQHELVLPLAPSERLRIPVNPKGAVIRKAVEEMFHDELDQLYLHAEALKSAAAANACFGVDSGSFAGMQGGMKWASA